MLRGLGARLWLALIVLLAAVTVAALAWQRDGHPTWLIGVAALLAALGTVLVIMVIVGPAAQRSRELSSAIRRLSAGDAEVRIPADSGEVGEALEELARHLTRSSADMRHERDLMASILEGMEDGILVLDDEDRIALVNPALRRTLLLPAEVVGRPPLEVIRHAELADLIRRARQVDGGLVTAEVSIAGIKPRRLLVKVSRFGRQRFMLLVFLDVTDLRRLETMRTDFVANVSHELRTPVAAVRSAAETLAGGALADPQAAAMFLDIIERNGERLQRLIEDLLDLSRIEARELRLSPEKVEVAEAVEHAMGLLREKAARGRVALISAVVPRAPAVLADRRALEQVLTNLVDNAIKYCPSGATVSTVTDVDHGMLRIAIRDTGPGIEPRHLPRLFERFYRVDPGRSREMGGTGLGLSIVKHLVEAQGGEVGVESTPGQGSSFWFTLPLWKPAELPPG